jgi:hypothetical protein
MPFDGILILFHNKSAIAYAHPPFAIIIGEEKIGTELAGVELGRGDERLKTGSTVLQLPSRHGAALQAGRPLTKTRVGPSPSPPKPHPARRQGIAKGSPRDRQGIAKDHDRVVTPLRP